MGLNLLGKKNDQGEGYQAEPEFYMPPDEPVEKKISRRELIKKQAAQKEKEQKSEKVEQEITQGVDFTRALTRRKQLIKLAIVAVIIILIGGTSGGVYYYLYGQPKSFELPVASTVTPRTPATTTVAPPLPTPGGTATSPQPVAPVPISSPTALPNTPLAPLRGSLIKFPGSSDVYLVEQNGELRKVNQATVIFDNGQSFSQINKNLIYELPIKWQETRRGAQDVTGRVDFDPRILSLAELLPFIR